MTCRWKRSPHFSVAASITVLVLACATILQTGCQGMGSYRPPTWLGSFRPARPSSTRSATITKPLGLEQKADIQFALGRNAETQGELDVAIESYQTALAKDDSRSDACHRLALLYERKGDLDKADAYYIRALEHSPENAEIHCDLGYSLYLRGQFEKAEAEYMKALQLQSDSPRTHINYGLLLARTGRSEEALREFFQAGIPERQARLNLAAALILEEHTVEAREQLELARRLDFGGESSGRIAQMERLVVSVGERVPSQSANSVARRLPETQPIDTMTR